MVLRRSDPAEHRQPPARGGAAPTQGGQPRGLHARNGWHCGGVRGERRGGVSRSGRARVSSLRHGICTHHLLRARTDLVTARQFAPRPVGRWADALAAHPGGCRPTVSSQAVSSQAVSSQAAADQRPGGGFTRARRQPGQPRTGDQPGAGACATSGHRAAEANAALAPRGDATIEAV